MILTTYLYSGEHPPASAFLRFMTYSTFPYEIKDVKFTQAGRYTFWSKQSSSGTSFPLYEKKHESPEGIPVYENMNFLPRARFVQELISIPDSNEAIYAFRYRMILTLRKLLLSREWISTVYLKTGR